MVSAVKEMCLNYRFFVSSNHNIKQFSESCHQIAIENRSWFWSDTFLTKIYHEAIDNLHIAMSELSILNKDKDFKSELEALNNLPELGSKNI